MSKLEERAFDRQEQDDSHSVDQHFYKEKSRNRCQRDAMAGTELEHGMNDELMAQVHAVSDAGDESCAGDFDSTEKQTWADGTNQQRSHSKRDKGELPNTGSDGEIAFANVQTVNDCR